MYNYARGSIDIQGMLVNFLKNGIDVNNLKPLDYVIEASEIDQIKILNSYLSTVDQRTLFGALRNINNILKVMKEKIKIARETHQNPTNLEVSLEIMEHLSSLAFHIDNFLNDGKLNEIARINELSRILYKKANYFGFYQDVDTQLKNAGITEEEAKAFVGKLNENIELEMIEDESSQ